ncbi:MAG TPA: sigma-70 family RNA polymerase sigma factor [Planctomycetota bacterium]|nr:sigma-70 family RNA polymerase sigma factor [Planctomycetota bacterium]
MVDYARPDALLIAEFLHKKSEAAFEALVRRHSRMVFNVCYRILQNAHDAEDAAQATFLTLAHKAASLAERESIAGWLHQVAWNIATRAREARMARSSHEQAGVEEATLDTRVERSADWDRLIPVLDRALASLPEKYRLPILLHHLQGQTQEQTARSWAARRAPSRRNSRAGGKCCATGSSVPVCCSPAVRLSC